MAAVRTPPAPRAVPRRAQTCSARAGGGSAWMGRSAAPRGRVAWGGAQSSRDGRHNGGWIGIREREGRFEHPCRCAIGEMEDGVADRTVDMAENEDLVPRREAQRAQDGVAADRRVLDKDDV